MLIVDDSAVVRRVISAVVAADPNLRLAGTRASGTHALRTIEKDPPDVIILDVEMPEMDGIEVLRKMRELSLRIPVFMFSSQTDRSAQTTLDALAHGAIDFVLKPTGTWDPATSRTHIQTQLIDKITAFFQTPNGTETRRGSRHGPQGSSRHDHVGSEVRARVLAIGCSTGGPNALAELLPRLPSNLPVPVLIAQHMPPIFTAHLAKRLNAKSGLTVREGRHGAELLPGEAWIAPGGHHMSAEQAGGRLTIKIDDSPPVNSCRPSIDVLLSSVAEHFGAHALAVIMTGMGTDGLAGCAKIHAAGGQIIAQDRESSVVWGMPGAVSDAGLACETLALDRLPVGILRRVARGTDSDRASSREDATRSGDHR